MKIIATGKSGTIGKYLGEEIIGVDFRKDSLLNEVQKISNQGPFSVVHLAGVVGEKIVSQNIQESRKVNVDKTIEFAENCLSKDLIKFFFISTSHVYSKSLNQISEESPLNPITQYAQQKLETENALKAVFSKSLEKLCILRVFSVLTYHSREFTLGAAIRKAAINSEFKIQNVDDERDFLHPHQISEIIQKLVVMDDLPPLINVCSGTAISVREGIQQVAKHNKIKINLDQLKSGLSENPKILGDATLLKNLVKQDYDRYKCLD